MQPTHRRVWLESKSVQNQMPKHHLLHNNSMRYGQKNRVSADQIHRVVFDLSRFPNATIHQDLGH